MSLTCPCSQPIHDNATICHDCTDHARARLTYLEQLWPQLQLSITRQDALPAGQGAEDEMVPFNTNASEVAWAVSNTITTWARVISEELSMPLPALRPTLGPACRWCGHLSCKQITLTRGDRQPIEVRMAAWIAERLHRVRMQDWAPELAEEVDSAAELAERAVDRPPDRVYLAQCDICSTDLYAKPGATSAQCRACFMVYDVPDRRSKILTRAEDHHGTASEIARALTSLGDPVTPERIWQWASRGRLLVKGRRGKRPMYLVRDVRDLLHTEQRRARGA